MDFPFFKIVMSGLIGTALMTIFVNFSSAFNGKPFKVILVLGSMLTGETTAQKRLSKTNLSLFTGITVHYLVGCIFSFLYYVWCKNTGGFLFSNTLVFGFAIGVISIIVWYLFFYIHSNPPRILLRGYLLTLLAGHLVFSLAIMLFYRFW